MQSQAVVPEQAGPPACPDVHSVYLTQHLADNMVLLHDMKHGGECSFHTFRCGDHFHVGHHSKTKGAACREASGYTVSRNQRGKR